MENIKFLVCPLVSSDLYRAKRAVKSCFNQQGHSLNYKVHVVINSLDDVFIGQMAKFCHLENISYSITESDGSPSMGKNSVFEYFNTTDFTHLAQLDGDDFYYPTFLRHMERHLRRYPTTDVLGVVPLDIIGDMEPNMHFEKMGEDKYITVWNGNFWDLRTIVPWGIDPMFTNTSTHNWCRHNFFTKKVTEKYKYNLKTIVGEDHRIHFELFSAHINEELIYWLSMASDTFVNDKTGISIQKTFSGFKTENGVLIGVHEELLNDTMKHIEKFLLPERSSLAELPVDYAPMFLSYEDKINFIKSFY